MIKIWKVLAVASGLEAGLGIFCTVGATQGWAGSWGPVLFQTWGFAVIFAIAARAFYKIE